MSEKRFHVATVLGEFKQLGIQEIYSIHSPVPGTWKPFRQNVDQPRAGPGWSSPVCNIPVSHPAWNVQIARAPSTRSNTGESNSFSFESLKDISYKATRNAWYMLLNAFNILYIIGPSANVFSSKLAVPRMRSCKSVVSGKDPPWWYHSGWCCAEEGTWIFPFYNSAHDRRLYIQPK